MISLHTSEVSQWSAKSAEIQRRARTNAQELLVDLVVTGSIATTSVSAAHLLPGATSFRRSAIEIQSTEDFVQFTPDTVQSRFMLLGSRRTHERFEC